MGSVWFDATDDQLVIARSSETGCPTNTHLVDDLQCNCRHQLPDREEDAIDRNKRSSRLRRCCLADILQPINYSFHSQYCPVRAQSASLTESVTD